MSTDLGADNDQVRGLYQERAHLLAVLAGQFPARLACNDPAEPELPVLYLRTPAGQISWHLNPDHLDLFSHVAWAENGDELVVWDGHSKPEALARLRQLATHSPTPTCARPTQPDREDTVR